ncbi:CAP domain-containing protein [Streptomyces gobiensis]|uniref:CAP domain-containing protein n=1 Tax=Streptomyces gobiensis TaxID=2875706 RepID=UPI001E5BB4FF|nr:CAP domain-containing protein [Streptomyces gobiensis]UGY93816.1 CAP domain-containing protein [Streptomyces gobiensis]
MGRHRRATPAPSPSIPAQRSASDGRHRDSHRKRGAAPVRTGMLGVSAAMAVGAVAVASGLVPGPGNGFTLGGFDDSNGKVRADGVPDLATQGATDGFGERGENPASRDQERTGAQSPSASPSPSRPSEKPSAEPSKAPKKPAPSSSSAGPAKPASPANPAKPSVKPPKAPQTPDAAESTAAQVLTLVNQERAKAGCQPVTADAQLAKLAGDFSEDMAVRGFFSHTDPDGKSPWDRADAAGISNLGAENIARGQANAQSVMDAWMNSPGHRANILNCDYKTLGVGAHFAPGGPWWTQNFGF